MKELVMRGMDFLANAMRRTLGRYFLGAAVFVVGVALHGAVPDWVRNAASDGHVEAQCLLGADYLESGDVDNAGKWLRAAGERGSVPSQLMLGSRLMYGGQGFVQDLVEAEKWLKAAAEHGSDDARKSLETLASLRSTTAQGFYSGLDPEKAAERGDANAQYSLGVRCSGRGDRENAAKWWTQAAEQNHVHAQEDLGSLLARGASGVARNSAEAEKWLRRAVGNGSVLAHVDLATLLCFGKDLPPRPEEGARLMRKAAMLGNAEAQHYLGIMYCLGRGVPEDKVEGMAWFILAVDSGAKDAAAKRDDCAVTLGKAGVSAAELRSKDLLAQIRSAKDASIPPVGMPAK